MKTCTARTGLLGCANPGAAGRFGNKTGSNCLRTLGSGRAQLLADVSRLPELEHVMTTAPSPFKQRSMMMLALAGIGCAAGLDRASAQVLPDIENGRYALSPVGDGVIRLDSRTGAVSSCSNSGAGWACYVVPDERVALDQEIGRLQGENEKLKAQLAREPVVAGKIEEPLPKEDSLRPAPPKEDAAKPPAPK